MVAVFFYYTFFKVNTRFLFTLANSSHVAKFTFIIEGVFAVDFAFLRHYLFQHTTDVTHMIFGLPLYHQGDIGLLNIMHSSLLRTFSDFSEPFSDFIESTINVTNRSLPQDTSKVNFGGSNAARSTAVAE
jgi:hypothetical protein